MSQSKDKSPKARPDLDTSSALKALARLREKGKGIHPSEGENFNHTLFTRDSAITARQLIGHDPTIAHETILALASRQGALLNLKTDEEPGRMHHEERDMREWKAGLSNKLMRSALSVLWGGSTTDMMTYFSMDATPLYLLLVSDYTVHDASILDEVVTLRDGSTISIAESIEAAADWIIGHQTRNKLIEIPRHNRYSLTHQTWKDSLTGYIHEDGNSLNLSQPIAYLEVQALAVDSLIRTADTLKKRIPQKAAQWKKVAEEITHATLHDFWEESSQYFISTIDRDKHGERRKNGVEQSDPGWLLNTAIFDHISERERKKYVSGIINKLFSDDFLTDAGIRSRSLQYADVLAVTDYHGALTSWPIDTYMISQGLRRQGFAKLADQLDTRIINSVNISGEFYEFFIVDKDGTVVLNIEQAKKRSANAKTLAVQFLPDKGFGWTVVADIMIKNRRNLHWKPAPQRPWNRSLEHEVLNNTKHISPIATREELKKRFAMNPGIYLSTFRGKVKTVGDLFEAFRPRLDRKIKKLSVHALKAHRI
jgi:glycogen debranching enzyme